MGKDGAIITITEFPWRYLVQFSMNSLKAGSLLKEKGHDGVFKDALPGVHIPDVLVSGPLRQTL